MRAFTAVLPLLLFARVLEPVACRRRRTNTRPIDDEVHSGSAPSGTGQVPHKYEGSAGEWSHGATKDMLHIFRESLHPDLLDAIRREAKVGHEINTALKQSQSKYTSRSRKEKGKHSWLGEAALLFGFWVSTAVR